MKRNVQCPVSNDQCPGRHAPRKQRALFRHSLQNWKLTILYWLLLLPAALFSESSTLVLKNANSTEFQNVNGEWVAFYKGNVTWVYEDVTIRSEFAKFWRNEGRVEFTKNVQVNRTKQRLTCDRMTYIKQNSMLVGQSNIHFNDSLERVIITGNRCQYNLKTRLCILEENPKVVRYDTAAAETLVIVARQLMYDDSIKLVTAKDSVTITKGALLSKSQFAYYFTKKDIALLRKTPRITYDRQKLNGDSVNLYFKDDTLDGMAVVGHGNGVYREFGKKDTSKTTVIGDSIYMAFTDTGSLDSAWVCNNVVSTYNLARDSLSPNQVSGKTMILAFGDESQVKTAKLWGNATSTYFIEDKDGTSRNDASGDTLSVWFEDGKATRLRLSGSVRGKYCPQ